MELRRLYLFIEETYEEGGRQLEKPLRRVAAAGVVRNPCASKYVDDLTELYDIGAELGEILSQKAVAALGSDTAHSFGKAAIVGMNGEREHAAAMMHPKLGEPMRKAVGGGKAIIPSAKKLGPPGTAIDVPLHYKDAIKVRSHFDAMEVRISDAPNGDEILLVVAVTNGGRPHPRVGGLQFADVVGQNGLD